LTELVERECRDRLRQVLDRADQRVVEGRGIAIESLAPGCAVYMTKSTWCG